MVKWTHKDFLSLSEALVGEIYAPGFFQNSQFCPHQFLASFFFLTLLFYYQCLFICYLAPVFLSSWHAGGKKLKSQFFP